MTLSSSLQVKTEHSSANGHKCKTRSAPSVTEESVKPESRLDKSSQSECTSKNKERNVSFSGKSAR